MDSWRILCHPDQTTFKVLDGEVTLKIPTNEEKKMKREAVKDKEYILVEDGLHQGTISDVVERHGKFKYLDINVTCEGYKYTDGSPLIIKVGVPDNLSPSSALGKILVRFGIDVTEGKIIDFDILLGKPCSYMTLQKKAKDDNIYNDVIVKTLKPLV